MTNSISQHARVALITGLIVSLLAPFMLLAYDAGNDALPRTETDQYTNFTIVDTNNPFPSDGTVTEFEYYAANTNPFRVVIVDEGNVVKWVSDEVTPTGVGVDTFSANVAVEAGWNLAIYSAQAGVIPFDWAGTAAEYTPNNDGLPTVGETLAQEGTTNRTYSLNATLETDEDNDGVVGGDDLCEGTVADAFPKYGDKTAKNRWMLNSNFDWVTNAKAGTMGTFAPTIEDTYGCSGEQILDILEEKTGLDFGGEKKYGITKGSIEAWIEGEYHVGLTTVETVEVPAEDVDGVESNTTLETDTDYVLKAYGTANAGDNIEFDADFSFRTGSSVTWTDAVSTYEYLGDTLLDLMVDGGFVTWGDGTFHADHTYNYAMVGAGAPVTLGVYDTYFPGNTGSLFVDIIEDKWVDLW
jgi:hypothetical protein